MRGVAIGRSSFRKSHPSHRAIGCRNLLGATYADIAYQRGRNELPKGRERWIYAEIGAADRERSHYSGMFAQRHPLQKRQARREMDRERKRDSYPPKTNQTGRDGIRRPPGATTDGFTPVHTRDRPSARPRCKLRHHLVYIQRTENHPNGQAAQLR